MIAAILLAIFLVGRPPACAPPPDPMAQRCGADDPTVDLITYEACLNVFGMTIS